MTATQTSQTDCSDAAADNRVQWRRISPFLLLHMGCLLVFVTGWSLTAVAVCVLLYVVRMFAITAFYHRLFSHRAFSASRPMQFVFAVLGNSAAQRGPLWWAAHHRNHHKHADSDRDEHSPHHRGFLWTHMGWFTTRSGHRTDLNQVRDLARYPELRFLDRFDQLVPLLLATSLFVIGEILAVAAPGLGTDGLQLLVWGFCISTVVLFHVTSLVNSLGHTRGPRRYETKDRSRNNAFLALMTLGEGWHNNHHHYPVAARQGFFWWEIDPTYYALRIMQKLGIVRDLREIPPAMLNRVRQQEKAA